LSTPIQSKIELRRFADQLFSWLAQSVYPLWSEHGIDGRNGGFVEALDLHGRPLDLPRRARVQPRQAYAFAQAQALGWNGDAATIVRNGLGYFAKHYTRADGLFRTLVDADGAVLDDQALLYDQAFALLAFAAAHKLLKSRGEYETRALQLRGAIQKHFAGSDAAFHASERGSGEWESNPHMHLLEACLAWAQVGIDPGWKAWARMLASLAASRFIDPRSGALAESSTRAGGVEPGHQFEWAWLLMRCEAAFGLPLRAAALRLIAVGESYGVYEGFAVNALWDDLSVKDGAARFWPQTERLKSALLAATLTRETHYWSMALAAANSFAPFLDTEVHGLWFDCRGSGGQIVSSPAPASTLYHLVAAALALQSAL
jgi:mannose/cellobiose epimerase-like protein (N-acyl-D-glucosamine 2-epimerase family)